jgi:hypothetical protein
MMRFIILSALLSSLVGCSTPTGRIAASAAEELRSEYRSVQKAAADQAETYLCESLRVREWQDRYGRDKARADGWRALCGRPIKELPFPNETDN